MDYNFQNESQLRIPQEAYRPYQRCEFCNSVYLTDNLCESCGRSVRYDLIGEAFGYKSFYGLKERYIKDLPILIRRYPIFENMQSPGAKSLKRQMQKRLSDLANLIEHKDKNLFDMEAYEIINELLFFGVHKDIIRSYLGFNYEFERYLASAAKNVSPKKPWSEEILSYRLWGTLRVKFVLVTSTLLAFIFYIVIFNLRSGR